MLTAVCPEESPPPRRPCSHHVVTAGGWQVTDGLTSRPYPGSKAIKLGPSSRNEPAQPEDDGQAVDSGIQDVTTPLLVSAE